MRIKLIWSLVISCLFFSLVQAEAAQAGNTIRVGLHWNTTSTQSFTVSEDFILVDGATGQTLASVSPGQNWQVSYAGGNITAFCNGSAVTTSSNPLICKKAGSTGTVTAQSISSPNYTILASGNQTASKAALEGMVVVADGGNQSTLGANTNIQVASADSSNALNTGGVVIGEAPTSAPVKVDNQNSSTGSAIFILNSTQYRGALVFRPSSSGFTVINELDMEDYLKSVVPSEMVPSWSIEALKAQAVAARSYALYRQQEGRYASSGFDLLSSTSSQLYQGIIKEYEQSSLAVEQTAGQVLVCNGAVIETFFSASNGGYTEASGDIWGTDLPYLQAAADAYDFNEATYNWSEVVTQQELVGYLGSYGFKVVTDLKVVAYTRSGARVKDLAISGQDSSGKVLTKTISLAEKVRNGFNLKSAVFILEKEFDANGNLAKVIFKGDGHGHGLGLSQYGAYGRALDGQSYQQILNFYYPNSQLVAYN